MGAHNYDDLREHVGHQIECVGYGKIENPVVIDGETVGYDRHYANVAVECEDCGVVLMDFDTPEPHSYRDAIKRAIIDADNALDAWNKVEKILDFLRTLKETEES